MGGGGKVKEGEGQRVGGDTAAATVKKGRGTGRTHRRPPRFCEPLHELLLLVDGFEVDREHRYTLAVVEALKLLIGRCHGCQRLQKKKKSERKQKGLSISISGAGAETTDANNYQCEKNENVWKRRGGAGGSRGGFSSTCGVWCVGC